jgi:hypothetical protein
MMFESAFLARSIKLTREINYYYYFSLPLTNQSTHPINQFPNPTQPPLKQPKQTHHKNRKKKTEKTKKTTPSHPIPYKTPSPLPPSPALPLHPSQNNQSPYPLYPLSSYILTYFTHHVSFKLA